MSHLICKKCTASLTTRLNLFNGNADDFNARMNFDNHPFAMEIHDSIWRPGDPTGRKEDGYLTTWITVSGLSRGTEDTLDYRRLNGCCGLDGLDGPNQVCTSCGSYVGTKITDCWTPKLFEPLANATEIKAII